MNHTPGPWHFDGHGINDSNGQRICKVCHSERYLYPKGRAVNNVRYEADSQLIAAAPDLLEWVKRLLKSLDDNAYGTSEEQLEAIEFIKKLEA
jgi:hypothetical protein